MPKLSWNALVEKHPRRYGVPFMFHDYLAAKKRNKGRVAPLLPNGKKPPTPNDIISAAARRQCKGDYAILLQNGGSTVVLVLADKADAERIDRTWGPSNNPAFQELTSVRDMWASEAAKLAQVLGLI